jgi:hypothetical protein
MIGLMADQRRNGIDANPDRGDTRLIPRILRLRDAPRYLGMDRNRFNAEVRPFLTNIPIGRQGIAFDRLELDAWVDDYISRNGRPAERRTSWDAENHQASRSEAVPGGSTRKLKDTEEWRKAAARIISKKRSATSRTD